MSKIFAPTVEQNDDSITFYLGLASTPEEEANYHEDVKFLAQSFGLLIPTFEDVDTLIKSRRPEIAVEDLSVVAVSLSIKDATAPTFYIASSNTHHLSQHATALRAELLLFAGAPSFNTVEELEAGAKTGVPEGLVAQAVAVTLTNVAIRTLN